MTPKKAELGKDSICRDFFGFETFDIFCGHYMCTSEIDALRTWRSVLCITILTYL